MLITAGQLHNSSRESDMSITIVLIAVFDLDESLMSASDGKSWKISCLT